LTIASHHAVDTGLKPEESRVAPFKIPELKVTENIAVVCWASLRRYKGACLAPFGFDYLVVALLITVILAIGWMRTYWNG
jgi:hypothetical protein